MPTIPRPLLNMMEHVYRVRHWEHTFETSESRKIKGPLGWVAIPTKHDGAGYKRAAKATHGAVALAGWWSLLGVAAKMPVRGLLASWDGPLDADDIAARTDLPAKIYVTALNLLSEERIGWLDKLPWDKNLDFAANIERLIGEQKLPADTSGHQRKSAALSGKQRTAKNVEPREKASAPQRTTADASGSQRDSVGNSSGQHTPEDASVQEKTGQNHTTPPAVPQGGQVCALDDLKSLEDFQTGDRVELLAAAKIRTCAFGTFGKKNPARPWSYGALQALSRLLPIPEDEWRVVEWFHNLPASDEIPELKNRRQSEKTLFENWGDEVTRALAYRKKNHAQAPSTPKKEPARWREFFQWKYGPECMLPDRFDLLGRTQRDEWDREHEEFDELPVAAAMETLAR